MATVYGDELMRMEAGHGEALQPLTITLSRYEWVNLLRALRENPKAQPQLGRLAWMSVSSIEAQIIDSRKGSHADGKS